MTGRRFSQRAKTPQLGPCSDCGKTRISQRRWRADPDRWRAQDCVRQGADDRCNTCYTRHRRTDGASG